MIKHLYIALFLAICAFIQKPLLSQDSLWLKVNSKIHYQDIKGHDINISKWAFYIGQIQGIKSENIPMRIVSPPQLIRVNPGENRLIYLGEIEEDIKHIWIQTGIDSALQHNTNWEGDLDPIHGMYWEWRTGYIDLKIEGQSPISPEKKHEVFFHIGGFLNGECTQQNIILPVEATSSHLIEVNLDHLFSAIDLETQHKVMTPGKAAVEMSNLWETCWNWAQK